MKNESAAATGASATQHCKEAQFRKEVLSWHTGNEREFPWRSSLDPYEVLVGELMLQRTRGENAVTIYKEFLRRWPNPTRLARARETTIAKVLRPLGLTGRSATFKRLGKVLASEGVPTRPAALQKLPGVGSYVSNAVPVFALGADLPLVDWVIARVLRRYFGLPEVKRPNADGNLWELAESLAERGRARDLWLGTLDLAAAVCRPKPLCAECVLNSSCNTGRARLVGVTPDA
jgi:A/G-specific adenine glycosylase